MNDQKHYWMHRVNYEGGLGILDKEKYGMGTVPDFMSLLPVGIKLRSF